MTYSLFIVTYDRGTYTAGERAGKTKPFHWSFFVRTTPVRGKSDPGVAFQLRGMPGAFYYKGPEEVDMGKSSSKKEILEVGALKGGDINQISARIHAILKALHIEKSESSRWNCQSWALNGFNHLAADSALLEAYVDQAAIKAWLQNEPGRSPTPTSRPPSRQSTTTSNSRPPSLDSTSRPPSRSSVTSSAGRPPSHGTATISSSRPASRASNHSLSHNPWASS